MTASTWPLRLQKCGQSHILKQLAESTKNPDPSKLFSQLDHLDQSIPGGIEGYVSRSVKLLQDAITEKNPFENYTVQESNLVPGIDYENLSGKNGPGSLIFEEFEQIGLEKLNKCGFVLVAGGLGERLGYPGIKVELPVDMCTEMCFLELYCEYVKAAGEAYSSYMMDINSDSKSNSTAAVAPKKLPLCIMTSGDTDQKTRELLKSKNYFGLDPETQIFIVTQDKVPAFSGTNGEFVLNSEPDSDTGCYTLETKPHGHGDVHTLLHMKGVAKKFKEEMGLEYLFFFQDTNPLSFKALVSALGVSVKRNLAMNSVAVPRKAQEAAGAIVKLVKKKTTVDQKDSDSPNLILNVEYCNLGGLLASQGGDCPINDNNDSAYPGNCNILLFKLDTYCAVLERSNGVMSEFVNPKFIDAEKTRFKPTRLECLMQDFPLLLAEHGFLSDDNNNVKANISFTTYDRWLCFTCVKNAISDARKKSDAKQPPDCSYSCEADVYTCNTKLILYANRPGPIPDSDAGAPIHDVEKELALLSESRTFLGITKSIAPKIIILPKFAMSLIQLRAKLKGGQIRFGKSAHKTMLIADGPISFQGNLVLDGALDMRQKQNDNLNLNFGETIQLKPDLIVSNAGAVLQEMSEDDIATTTSDALKIRGYTVKKTEVFELKDVMG